MHAVGVLVVFALAVSVPFQAQALPLEGQPAPTTIVAPTRTTFIDTIATNRRKAQVEQETPPVYDSNLAAAQQNRQAATVFFQGVDSILANGRLSAGAKRTAIGNLLRSSETTSGNLPNHLPVLTVSDWHSVQYWSLRLLGESLELPGFDSTQNTSVMLTLLATLPRSVGPAKREAIAAVVAAFLTPTLVIDQPATTRKQQEAASAVSPITTTVPAGAVVVRRGQIVTPAVMQELRALGLATKTVSWQERLGSILFAALLIVLLFWYLHVFHADLSANNRLLLLVDLTILVTVIAAKLIVPGHVLLPYFFPVAAGATLCALLVSTQASVAITVALALLVGWVVGGSFELTSYYLVTGVAGALAVRNLRRLNDFIFAGGYVAVAAFALIMSFRLLDRSYDLEAIRNYVLAAGANGFLSAALALGAFALLANLFGVATTLHLLELAHPDQKLLRKLMVDAPGTYNHSLVVAAMVERASRDIGANALLAKVSALYHDIGKIVNPHCFVENQMGMPNIHDELSPEQSARIIKGHVTHGVRLAKQHRLPGVIRDAIVQHHGTMTIPYFLHRALQEDPFADVQTYMYPGPPPRSKECAILLLADGCEAAVRASGSHSGDTIHAIVDRIIDERVAGGQLSECDLTLRDLEVVRQSFIHVLNGLYHPRIEYPEALDMPRELSVEQ